MLLHRDFSVLLSLVLMTILLAFSVIIHCVPHSWTFSNFLLYYTPLCAFCLFPNMIIVCKKTLHLRSQSFNFFYFLFTQFILNQFCPCLHTFLWCSHSNTQLSCSCLESATLNTSTYAFLLVMFISIASSFSKNHFFVW